MKNETIKKIIASDYKECADTWSENTLRDACLDYVAREIVDNDGFEYCSGITYGLLNGTGSDIADFYFNNKRGFDDRVTHEIYWDKIKKYYTEKQQTSAPERESFKYYFIFCENRDHPTYKHNSFKSAKTETERLCIKHPDRKFYICEIISAFKGSIAVDQVDI